MDEREAPSSFAADKKTAKLLRKTSIRGRMGLAMACIVYYARQVERLESRVMEDIFLDFWHFTASADLGYWDRVCIRDMDAIWVNRPCSRALTDLLDNALAIGQEHLYSSITESGEEETIRCLLEILEVVRAAGVRVEGLEALARFSPFRTLRGWFSGTECWGWGKPFLQYDLERLLSFSIANGEEEAAVPSRQLPEPERRGNVFATVPASDGMNYRELAALPPHGARIVRVGADRRWEKYCWYPVDSAKWVLLLRGAADFECSNPPAVHRLEAGDWLLLPRGEMYCVPHTEEDAVWLEVRGT